MSLLVIKGLPEYDTSKGGKKIIHKIVNEIEYKWCGGLLCLDKEGEGIWKELFEFNKCSSRWDKLETICKKCKKYKRSDKRKKEKKVINEQIKKRTTKRILIRKNVKIVKSIKNILIFQKTLDIKII